MQISSSPIRRSCALVSVSFMFNLHNTGLKCVSASHVCGLHSTSLKHMSASRVLGIGCMILKVALMGCALVNGEGVDSLKDVGLLDLVMSQHGVHLHSFTLREGEEGSHIIMLSLGSFAR